jgi:RimJ/RimL family protein N-acetyltransferase
VARRAIPANADRTVAVRCTLEVTGKKPQGNTMIEAPLLVTPRLRLRMLQAEDFDEYAAIHSDIDVTRFTTRVPLTREEAWKHMAPVVGHWHLRGYGMWGVEEIATKKLVGRVGYHCPEGWPEYELGWTIGREFWGKGFATEAARAALEYGFDVMRRDHIISLIDPDNGRSIAVAERLGQTLEGEREIAGYRLLVYGISR